MWWQNIMHQRLTIAANGILFSFFLVNVCEWQEYYVAQFSHNFRSSNNNNKIGDEQINQENPLNLFSSWSTPIEYNNNTFIENGVRWCDYCWCVFFVTIGWFVEFNVKIPIFTIQTTYIRMNHIPLAEQANAK